MYYLLHVALCVYVCIPIFFFSEVCIPSLLVGYYRKKIYGFVCYGN